ncbi:MAG: tetratricopeptide repeat protein [Thermoanaerobaculia bacterium]|nr:tetratricopeptide repeat protein [Thermoanaerobaculia bacterium]
MPSITHNNAQILGILGWLLLASLTVVRATDAQQLDEPGLGTLSAEPLAWARSIAPSGSRRQVVASLAAALLRRGWREEDDLTLDANAAFEQRAGNCVSFALLLADLARSRGVPAVFVIRGPDLARGPEIGDRRGDLQVDRSHLAVGLEGPDELVVFDLAGSHRATSDYRRVSDEEALGIFYSNRGAALLLEGRESEAIVVLREATQRAPALVSSWLNLGVALLRSQEVEGAEAAYRRAVALEPESVAAWRNLALLLERRTHETD